ncbi:hypothetical protein L0B52_02105 [Suttonella sp. R2A3]|uniref:hypothetical protein n=1 Tax=Suttonella sp. R2A3 TaxID=2908648 RepID=UPI001F16F9BB|nr:hypothetical protein [Suttonella sp. R2A3]UJF24956.1 hypothetical protein L0B52_02105 [Suttonella sp. R2A3]
MRFRDVFAKEWRLLCGGAFYVSLLLMWLGLTIYLLAAFEAYQDLAPKLAQLNNQRGATELLLGQGSRVVVWLIIIFSLYFAARCLGIEREWRTDQLWRFNQGRWRVIWAKLLVLLIGSMLVALPFWLFVGALTPGTDWDNGLLWAMVLAQGLVIIYALLLGLMVSAKLPPLVASLCLALIWLLLWLMPILLSSPDWLVAITRWLSPFEHIELLHQGILSMQTVFFLLLHILCFTTLLSLFLTEES